MRRIASSLARTRVGVSGAENQKTLGNHALVNVFRRYGFPENDNIRKRYSKVRFLPFLRFPMTLSLRACAREGRECSRRILAAVADLQERAKRRPRRKARASGAIELLSF
jgi:hypothetical protein